MSYSYTINDLEIAVKRSFSYRQTLIYLGLNGAGSNYFWVKKNITDNSIDISHFTGKAWAKGVKHNRNEKYPLIDIFNGLHPSYSVNRLRTRLLAAGLKQHKCEMCLMTEWMNKPIPIELDHINGCPTDHRLENLRIVCPNCHAQTESYRRKKTGSPGGI